MNYFPWHIGDYAAHTGHLEPMEDLIYRRLLDAYYLREAPLPVDVQATSKLIRLRSMADDVEAILREFFTLTDEGWRHGRCDQEIARMQDKQAKARAAAELSVKSRQAKAERTLNHVRQTSVERALGLAATDVERTLAKDETDVELPTPTPTPISPSLRSGDTRARALPCPDGVQAQTWADWLALRKAKKAPVTPTVVASAASEAAKAGMTLEAFLQAWCARGSQGLQADWLTLNERPAASGAEPEWRRRQRERNEEFLGPASASAAAARRASNESTEATNALPLKLG